MLVLATVLALTCGCSGEKGTKRPLQSIVMTAELVNDSAAIRKYDSLHSASGVWPELKKANLASGIEEIRIYRFANRIVMILDVPEGTDLGRMDSLYVNADPRVREWGALMSGFQRALPGVDSNRKWVGMELIHHYRDGEYLK